MPETPIAFVEETVPETAGPVVEVAERALKRPQLQLSAKAFEDTPVAKIEAAAKSAMCLMGPFLSFLKAFA